jgi:hypothetical protein
MVVLATTGGLGLQGLVAGAGGMALVVVGQLAVRAETVTGVLAPEGAIVAVRDGGVPHGFDVQTLPAKVAATLRTDSRQAGALAEVGVHVYAPDAARSARFTATWASFTL